MHSFLHLLFYLTNFLCSLVIFSLLGRSSLGHYCSCTFVLENLKWDLWANCCRKINIGPSSLVPRPSSPTSLFMQTYKGEEYFLFLFCLQILEEGLGTRLGPSM